MIIRWLGAYGKAKTGLRESLLWELTQRERRAVAAERLVKGRTGIKHARVGLLVANRAVLRRYRSDVWSVYREDTGMLVKTRREGIAKSHHTECFVRPDYKAIVIQPIQWVRVGKYVCNGSIDTSWQRAVKHEYFCRLIDRPLVVQTRIFGVPGDLCGFSTPWGLCDAEARQIRGPYSLTRIETKGQWRLRFVPLSEAAWRAVQDISREFGLPVLKINKKGRLKPYAQ